MDIIISNLENSANDNNIDSLDFSAKKIIKSTASRVSEKDINCVRITQIQSIGEQWAYDLSCEKNHNFFANGFLCHNCILWADEIEKGLSGAMGAGSGDSGTTKRVIGTFLTWLQEKTAPVFVICTANNVHDIPPEFMRAGRFDEVFFIDLPTKEGRKQIFEVLLRKIKYNSKAFDIEELATLTEGFSGAEIEKLIENTMFECFCDNKRDITHADLVFGCRDISPLSKTRDKEFLAMREWAKGRCKMANTANKQEVFIQKNKNQSLDL
jgi:SpoVK/Ycf46/Vps4 family AAA+-type ATPase